MSGSRRPGRPCSNTSIGSLEEVEALRRRLGHDEDQPVGRVRAAAATQALVHLFAPHFRAFMEAYPRVEVVFRSTVSTDKTVADILAGVADVGFASKPVYSATLQVTEPLRG